MTDRLQELLRQRASIQAHLDWLDREIATAREVSHVPVDSAAAQVPVAAIASSLPLPSTSASQPVLVGQNAQADEIIAQYRLDKDSLRTDVRKGCLLYFFGALAFLGLCIVAFYLLNRLLKTGAP
jgi:hypothetical protein